VQNRRGVILPSQRRGSTGIGGKVIKPENPCYIQLAIIRMQETLQLPAAA